MTYENLARRAKEPHPKIALLQRGNRVRHAAAGHYQALLSSPGGPSGPVRMNQRGRTIRLHAALQRVAGTTALVNVATTAGNEVVECSIDPARGPAYCDGELLGDR